MSKGQHKNRQQLDQMIEVLFDSAPTVFNDDLHERAQILSTDRHWVPTKIQGLEVCVLELFDGEYPRMSALLRLNSNDNTSHTKPIQIPSANLELLLHQGELLDDKNNYSHPVYVRQPEERRVGEQVFTLKQSAQKINESHESNTAPIDFYFATGQLAPNDTERRCIDLTDDDLWLPGPVDNTEVLPLHMHNGNNSMLVRWTGAASFKPKLDPMGEEVLVITGTLADNQGTYPEGSWIRNPVSAWQDWQGHKGTLIYYKNGHFGQH